MVKQDKSFTMEDFEMRYGWPCELCKRFNMEENVCAKGRHPRKYTLLDGPNEFCHAIKFCMEFSKWVDDDTSDEGIKNVVNFALDSGRQQYC